MEGLKIVFTGAKDILPICKFLLEAGLSHEDIASNIQHFLLAKKNDILVGTVGLEVLGEFGLLRSLAVVPDYRGKGIGDLLYSKIIAYACSQGVKQLYLLTTTLEGFLKKRGFHRMERCDAPEPVRATEEFRTLCPLSAVCMTRKIGEDARHYPKEILRLKKDVPGAKMWAVALEKTMLTYFEVQPYCRFESYSHESEQITMVFEGELFFEYNGKISGVKEGEVMAIPSNIPHAVFTKERAVKAVDAWSPVMNKYRYS